MAHELVFNYEKGNDADPCSLDDVVESYIEFHKQMDVSDMLDMTRNPEKHIERLASWAVDMADDDNIYTIGKFGSWYCANCTESDIRLGEYDEDCDHEE
jgi:hypothetical protein